jgi:hypothetical protein
MAPPSIYCESADAYADVGRAAPADAIAALETTVRDLTLARLDD